MEAVMRRQYGWVAALIGISLAAVAFAACGDDDGGNSMGGSSMSGEGMGNGMMDGAPNGAILVRLSNWTIDPSKSSVKAGEITFRAVHDMHDMHSDGEGKTHELVVARKNKDGTFDIVGEAEDIGVGERKDLTLQLAKGDYELQCNILEKVNGKDVSHYQKGMHKKFVVT
jgi:uncharacterized cupredoxin-like copper-binding protein